MGFLQEQVSTALPWYAVYTNSRHEKRVASLLESREIDCFLPIYKTVRKWQDRRKEVELPLFPGYLFVRMETHARLKVVTVPGLVRIVGFDGRPAPIEESVIESLRTGAWQANRVEPHPYLKIGRRVRVRYGPLQGMQGILVRRKDRFRLVLSIDLIMRSVSVEVDEEDVESLS